MDAFPIPTVFDACRSLAKGVPDDRALTVLPYRLVTLEELWSLPRTSRFVDVRVDHVVEGFARVCVAWKDDRRRKLVTCASYEVDEKNDDMRFCGLLHLSRDHFRPQHQCTFSERCFD